jgi:hypothetical protein
MKTTSLKRHFLILVTTVLPFCYCGLNPPDAGNSSQVGNPVVSMLYNPDGSPAIHAKVYFYPVNYNPHTGGLGKTVLAASVDSTTTDSNGNYIATLDSGTYNILASGSGNLAYQDSINTIKDDTARPNPDTLHPAGSIRGVVLLEEGGDPTTAFILFMGTKTFTFPDDTTGAFTSDSMAAGDYRVRIITTTPNYRTLDTTLRVIAGTQNVLPGPLVLKYTGIPTPKNVRIVYDTLKQIVTLMWDSANATLVSSYNVYRRNLGLNTVPVRINVNPVFGTMYRDSTGIQDSTYEYQVAAVNTGAIEGTKSAAVQVTVVSAFTLLMTLNVANISTDVAKATGASTSQNFYILSRAPTAGVFLLDSSGAEIDSFGLQVLSDPYEMTQDSLGNFYISDMFLDSSLGTNVHRIIKFNSIGEKLKEWNIPGSANCLTVYDSILIAGTNFGVYLFSLDGASIGSFTWSETNLKGLAVGSNGYLFLYGNKTISKFTLNGSFIDSIYNTDLSQLPGYNDNGYLLSIGNSMLMFILNKFLYIIDEDGNLISKLTSIGIPRRIHFSVEDKTIWIPDISTNVIRVYRLN